MRHYIWRYPRGSYIQERWFDLGNPGLDSITKPLTASCLYMLKERGKIAWDDLVSKHWSEFAQNGKETVTIRHILTHRGGFPQTPESLPWTDWSDWSKVTRAMEQAPTIYTPGETLAYHPINYGWVIAVKL